MSDNGQPTQPAVPLPAGTTAFVLVAMTQAGDVHILVPAMPSGMGDKLFLAGLLEEGKRQALGLPVQQAQAGLVLPNGSIPDPRGKRR